MRRTGLAIAGVFTPARHLLFPLLVAEICLAPYWVAARALLDGGWRRRRSAWRGLVTQ